MWELILLCMFLHDTGAAQQCRLAPAPVPVALWPSFTSPGPCDTRLWQENSHPWGVKPCVCRPRALVGRSRGACWFGHPSHRHSTSCPSCQVTPRGINSGIQVSYKCVCSIGSLMASLAQTDALQTPNGTNVIHGLYVNYLLRSNQG